jgi:hypothetical protein
MSRRRMSRSCFRPAGLGWSGAPEGQQRGSNQGHKV